MCVLLRPCTLWVWAVTMRQLCTFCSVPSAPVQKPIMSPARPMPYSMLNKGNVKKVIRYCIRQTVQLVEASRPQGTSCTRVWLERVGHHCSCRWQIETFPTTCANALCRKDNISKYPLYTIVRGITFKCDKKSRLGKVHHFSFYSRSSRVPASSFFLPCFDHRIIHRYRQAR